MLTDTALCANGMIRNKGSFNEGGSVSDWGLRAMTACLALGALPAGAQSDAPEGHRQRELVHLVRQDCGSCHGLTLQGGLGPALTPAALRQRPRESLAATIMGGRPGTPMPPFRGIVSEGEAAWIVERLIEGFPADPGSAGQ